ncbi:MAG: hypothetical protein IT168_21450 [Bryobacterales bacterium]|nr:hypothetical protein [Bryobacterales bacterium]
MFSVRLRFFPSLICFSLYCTQIGFAQSIQTGSGARNINSGLQQSLPIVDQLTLLPSGTFELPIPGCRLRHLQANDSALYGLCTAAGGGEIVRLNKAGSVLDSIRVPGRTRDFAVGPAGEVVTLVDEGQESVTRGPYFSPLAPGERRIRARISLLHFIGERLLGFHDAAILGDLQVGSATMTALPIHDAYRVAGLGNRTLAIVGCRRPTLWKLDASLQLSSPTLLHAPELRVRDDSDTGLSIYAIAAHSSGDIFCAASPYNGKEGARILRFDLTGKLKARIRAVMPEFPETMGRGDGRLTASLMAVSGDLLFLGSATRTTSRVAYFPIPK